MSDTTQTLQLPGALLESIEQSDNEITLHFSQVHLIQEMEAAFEDSLWTQAVKLTVSGITLDGELPACPCEIESGALTNNIYPYRDHAPLPIDWQGSVSCNFKFVGNDAAFAIDGTSMQLDQIDHPRYIRHIKKT